MFSKNTKEILDSYLPAEKKELISRNLKKVQLYKHVSINKNAKSLLVKGLKKDTADCVENTRSYSLSNCKACEKLSPKGRESLKPVFPTDLLKRSINIIRKPQKLPNFILGSMIKVGFRLADPAKIQALKKITENLFSSSEASFHFFYNEDERSYNVLILGSSAPLSKCCSSGLVVQVYESQGGKVVCPQRSCFIKCLSNFLISKEDQVLLFPPGTPVKLEQKKRFNTLKEETKVIDSLRERLFFSKYSVFSTPKNRYGANPINYLLSNKIT